jgi:outer membrane protein assembly factor BamB
VIYEGEQTMKNQGLQSTTSSSFIFVFVILLMISLFGCSSNNEKGWPNYRHDGFRSGVTESKLPEKLAPQWVFKTTNTPTAAWHKPGEELPRMHSDNAYHVTAANGLTYFGSSTTDKLYALDTSTGKVRWTFFTGGPIRFAPSIYKNRIYVGSDDGYVYCLKASSGKMIWKYRAGPSDKKVLGNGRMISLWPVRTSVLSQDGVVYFSAGVFPYEGIYICALEAKSGNIVWKNDTVGDKAHELQFGGISPHGYLLASKDILYVPSGRAMPTAFNRKSGKFLFTLSPGSKVGGTWGLISDDWLVAGVDRSGTPAKVAYDVATGRRKGDAFVSLDGIDMVTTSKISYVVTDEGIHAIDRLKFPTIKNNIDSLQKEIAKTNSSMRAIAQANLESPIKSNKKFNDLIAEIDLLKAEKEKLKNSATKWHINKKQLDTIILADDKIVSGGKNIITLFEAETGREIQELKIDGTAMGLAVSNGRLLATTENGQIYCFGEKTTSFAELVESDMTNTAFEKNKLSGLYQKAAEQILKTTGVQKGYCLVLNAGKGQLAYELAQHSDLNVVGIEKDDGKIKQARENLNQAGLYGSRIVIENWDIKSLPDYFANLIVSDDFIISGKINSDPKDIYRVLKPHGGMVCFGQLNEKDSHSRAMDKESLSEWMEKITAQAPLESNDNGTWMTVERKALEGAGEWTHQYSNPANTICSDDKLTNYPFGVLWFGEPGPEKMVERHARAAAPLAKDGLLFIQGENVIMAYDSYNGIKMWEREIPGANRVRVDVDGSNLALSENGLLVATGDQCLLLEAKTGKTLNTFKLPASPDGKPRRWAYIACSGPTLFGTAAKPFDNDYNHMWKTLVAEKDKSELDQSDMSSFISSQMQSPDKAWNDMQQSGAKWRFITEFPAWNGGIVTQEPATNKIMFSDALFAMDIKTGKTKWIHRGNRIAHISISIGDGKVHFAENVISIAQKERAINERQKYRKKGIWKSYSERLNSNLVDVRLVTALNSETGEIKWQRPIDVSGCGGDAVASAYKNNTLLFFGSFGLHDKWRFGKGELKWHRVTALSSDTGNMRWSRPLNYMVRPVIVENSVIVEPRACDLLTGEIQTRIHPITGETVPWEYYRPGHTCAVTSASSTCLFYRSYNAAFYDLKNDQGITYYGAIRPGCWINMVPANGLLLFPEASAGCTCSFPLRTTMVLKPQAKENVSDWSVFTSQGPITPVKRLAINLGAPGDKKDDNGQLWFGYPRPKTEYGIKFDLDEKVLENMGYFYYDVRGVNINGTDNPWLYTSGCAGFSECTIPLIDERWSVEPGLYTVRLGFYAPSGKRVFNVKLQGETVLNNFNVTKETGRNKQVVLKEFKDITVDTNLLLELIPRKSAPQMDQAPIINSIEIIRQDSKAIGETKAAQSGLKEIEINQYLQTAKSEMMNKNYEKALNFYHAVFESSSSNAIQAKALIGMETIGSTQSLSVIEKHLRHTTEIYWDYEMPSPDLIDKITAVYIAIAHNVGKQKPEKAKAMLQHAMQLATGIELRDKISSKLLEFGAESNMAIPEKVAAGIKYDYFEGHFNTVSSFDLIKSKSTGIMNTLKLDEPEGVDAFGYDFNGYLSIPKDGIYTFFIESNDGSKLYIQGRELIDNDGAHGAKEESGIITLKAGLQPISVKYFQMGSDKKLKVSWQSDDFKKVEIGEENLFHEAAD